MLRHSSVLDIGKRNADAVLDLLRFEQIPVLGTSLGGTLGRSMQLRLRDGFVIVRLLGRGEEHL
jgi:chemotaxis receptor (MCP) glutamine deamidase CheD